MEGIKTLFIVVGLAFVLTVFFMALGYGDDGDDDGE